jgi:hypothetical protein
MRPEMNTQGLLNFERAMTAFLLSIAAVFTPIRPMLATVMVLTLLDAFTGVLAANRRGERITSHGFRRTIGKLLVYQVATLTAFLTESFLIPELPVTKIVAGAVGITEFKSILENLDSLAGVPILKVILQKLDAKEVQKEASEAAAATAAPDHE